MTTAPKPDLVIRNASIIDGSGAPARSGDIAIAGDRVSAIGALAHLSGAAELDVGGRAVAPGFIDVHTHDDRAVLSDPDMTCKVSQGVTTVVTGNCGISLAPLKPAAAPPPPSDLIGDRPEHYFADFGAYLSALDRDPPAVNVVAQVGHSTLRIGAMDGLDRAATPSEIARMRGRLEDSLAAGAVGMSTGLFYPPANAAPTEEVVELAAALAPAGAIHSTHMRDETAHVLESLDETFEIGRKAHVPVVISHHKCAGTPNHGRTLESLPKIDAARETQPIALDVYPYVAGSTVLNPHRMMSASRVIVTWSKSVPEAAGRDLSEIAAAWGCTETTAAERLQPAGAIYFIMDEEDVRRVLSYPHAMIGSDGLPHDQHPHPRLWGTFPRVLGHYARDVGLFPLEEAVRRMTGLSAAQFGLTDRGVLRAGAYADLVVFDPRTVADCSTWEEPARPASGIELVMVNGRAVWQAGAGTGARPGRALRLQELGPKGRDREAPV
ncbi:MAG: D-aminoacylase [Rhodospirillales bacterium]|nr:D-aminoacylase [Rhodospirillales bacterium]MCY4005010.1 D-aminoacylase [Rhodospirillales bacterium]MDE0371912.1 D-aminoacylase [Rhodospirillales bacterium]